SVAQDFTCGTVTPSRENRACRGPRLPLTLRQAQGSLTPQIGSIWGCRFADVASAAPFTAVPPSGWRTAATRLLNPRPGFRYSLQAKTGPAGSAQIKPF